MKSNIPLIIAICLMFVISTTIIYKVFNNKIGNIEGWRIIVGIMGYLILNIVGFIFIKKLLK
jgi:hypothetical protein